MRALTSLQALAPTSLEYTRSDLPDLPQTLMQIFHEALAKGEYTCFLSENTVLPMMYMPDLLKGTIG